MAKPDPNRFLTTPTSTRRRQTSPARFRDGKHQVGCYVGPNTNRRVRVAAAALGMNLQRFMSNAVDHYLEKLEAEGNVPKMPEDNDDAS